MTTLEIYLYVAPLLVLAVGLTAFGIAMWADRREQRRHPAE